jgi:hypothetical protein
MPPLMAAGESGPYEGEDDREVHSMRDDDGDSRYERRSDRTLTPVSIAQDLHQASASSMDEDMDTGRVGGGYGGGGEVVAETEIADPSPHRPPVTDGDEVGGREVSARLRVPSPAEADATASPRASTGADSGYAGSTPLVS